jgi:phosphoglycolate phosphatase
MQVSDTSPVSLVCCDLAGAILADGSALEKAFAEALATQGVVPGTTAYARHMVQVDRSGGAPPRDVMHALFSDDAQAQAAYLAFERSYRAVVDRFGITAAPGAVEAISKLAGSHVKVCLITGFSQAITRFVLDRLGLNRRADLTLCLDDVPRGCPWPDLVLTAVVRLGIEDVAQVAVVGNSENVILAGRRAGSGTLVGMAGARSGARLRHAGATHVIGSIADLPDLVQGPARPEAGGGERGRGHGETVREPRSRDSPRHPRTGIVPPQVTLRGKHAGL